MAGAYSGYTPHSIINRQPHEMNPGGGATDVVYEHLPAWRQIQNILDAGERFMEYRKENYHFGFDEEVPADFYDRTLEPGFDIVDAANLLEEVSDRRLKQEAVARATREREIADKQRAEAAAQAPEPPVETAEPPV